MSDAAPLPELFRSLNIHCHTPRSNAIVCVSPGDVIPPVDYLSAGIHPWDAEHADEVKWEQLRELAVDPRTIAIGECGLDRRKGPALNIQMPVFRRQAELAEQVGKPLIIHAVGTFNELIALKREFRPSVTWIIHGFRGKAPLAAQLVKHGFYLSLGTRFNPAVPQLIPNDFLLSESDD